MVFFYIISGLFIFNAAVCIEHDDSVKIKKKVDQVTQIIHQNIDAHIQSDPEIDSIDETLKNIQAFKRSEEKFHKKTNKQIGLCAYCRYFVAHA